ncbi:MAG: transaldolase family protein, partial [Pirellulaceae bacterium]|nr:transaldolase family protein [Pirellulaceae bacterium]
DVAWQLTDQLVSDAQREFAGVWEKTSGDDGYVSFELDPLIEADGIAHEDRVARYIELGQRWWDGANRLIKVPATAAGLAALEPLAAAGVTLNVTLIFSPRQYEAARDAVWRGASARGDLTRFKSVYSIFVSRVDVYTDQHVPALSAAAQGQVGIVNAKRIWADNQRFWSELSPPLAQEIVFASTGVKQAGEPAWKYVAALAGSDIETNPPATNDAVQESDVQFDRQVDRLPPQDVLDDIDAHVDSAEMERVLMAEGVDKFCKPQQMLLNCIATKRDQLGD